MSSFNALMLLETLPVNEFHAKSRTLIAQTLHHNSNLQRHNSNLQLTTVLQLLLCRNDSDSSYISRHNPIVTSAHRPELGERKQGVWYCARNIVVVEIQ